mmetsp:Transcript_10643/g.38552  ORF Transcript_10643/g.38552 Transcript_10643/m.38552 type:complete len:287 (+) Transcript_10643:1064-1924(+)
MQRERGRVEVVRKRVVVVVAVVGNAAAAAVTHVVVVIRRQHTQHRVRGVVHAVVNVQKPLSRVVHRDGVVASLARQTPAPRHARARRGGVRRGGRSGSARSVQGRKQTRAVQVPLQRPELRRGEVHEPAAFVHADEFVYAPLPAGDRVRALAVDAVVVVQVHVPGLLGRPDEVAVARAGDGVAWSLHEVPVARACASTRTRTRTPPRFTAQDVQHVVDRDPRRVVPLNVQTRPAVARVRRALARRRIQPNDFHRLLIPALYLRDQEVPSRGPVHRGEVLLLQARAA